MKNRICLVLPCNIYAAPYYFRYEKLLNELKIDFDLIIWNRDLILEKSSGNIISFDLADVANSGEKKKVYKYFRFASFVKRKLKEKNYDRVIFLSTSAGTVSLLSIFLSKHYQNRYWIDIRDYSFEWFKPYKFALSIAIKNSFVTSVSSTGFEQFLPKHNYIPTHNIDFSSIEKCIEIEKIAAPPIRISFIGNVRYFDENKKILDIFKNDSRFILQYYGKQSEILRDYCKDQKIENVDFYGRFEPEMTAGFYANTHIINNVYGNGGVDLTSALSNKLYFAASLQIPILVSPNTFMEEISTRYKFGFNMDLEDKVTNDKLYEWYTGFDKNTCEYSDFMKVVLEEYKNFEKKLKLFVTG